MLFAAGDRSLSSKMLRAAATRAAAFGPSSSLMSACAAFALGGSIRGRGHDGWDTSLWPVVVGGLLTGLFALGGIGVGLVGTACRDAPKSTGKQRSVARTSSRNWSLRFMSSIIGWRELDSVRLSALISQKPFRRSPKWKRYRQSTSAIRWISSGVEQRYDAISHVDTRRSWKENSWQYRPTVRGICGSLSALLAETRCLA